MNILQVLFSLALDGKERTTSMGKRRGGKLLTIYSRQS